MAALLPPLLSTLLPAAVLGALPGASRLPLVVAAALAMATVVVVCRRRGWTRTHRGRARGLLYAAVALLLAAAAWWGSLVLEEGRQAGLLTRLSGADLMRPVDPLQALRVFDEVLASDPDDDNRRRARLGRAAALDQLERFEEAEAAYRQAEAEWRAGLGRGPLHLPWASMRLRAGRPAEAVALLDAPGALEAFGTPAEAEAVAADLRQRAASRTPGTRPAGGAPDPD